MKIDQIKRREFLQIASVIGLSATTSGYSLIINAAGEKVLNARTDLALAALDPGYMVGGSEITVQWAMTPRLASFAFDSEGALSWESSDFVTKPQANRSNTYRLHWQTWADVVKRLWQVLLSSCWNQSGKVNGRHWIMWNSAISTAAPSF
jgi:hypothetical protein